MADNSIDNMPQKWINTPYSYAQLTITNNLTLTQQAVLLKVSSHLQHFFKEYFGSERSKSRQVPRSLLSDAIKKDGLMTFRMDYAELGIAPNNYPAAQKTAEDALHIPIKVPYRDKDTGKEGMKFYPVFTSIDVQNKGSITFKLNTEIVDPILERYVVDYSLDMSTGYITHPEDIALIGRVERMPAIYYILQKESGPKWKQKTVHLTVSDIKTRLGMIKEDGTEQYPKFSQFLKMVLIPSIEDINRLHNDGKIDIRVNFDKDKDIVRPRGKKTGTPSYIIFNIDTAKSQKVVEAEKAAKAAEAEAVRIANGEPEKPVIEEQKVEVGAMSKEWYTIMANYDGAAKEMLMATTYKGLFGGFMTVEFPDQASMEKFNKWEEKDKAGRKILQDCIVSVVGPHIGRILKRTHK